MPANLKQTHLVPVPELLNDKKKDDKKKDIYLKRKDAYSMMQHVLEHGPDQNENEWVWRACVLNDILDQFLDARKANMSYDNFRALYPKGLVPLAPGQPSASIHSRLRKTAYQSIYHTLNQFSRRPWKPSEIQYVKDEHEGLLTKYMDNRWVFRYNQKPKDSRANDKSAMENVDSRNNEDDDDEETDVSELSDNDMNEIDAYDIENESAAPEESESVDATKVMKRKRSHDDADDKSKEYQTSYKRAKGFQQSESLIRMKMEMAELALKTKQVECELVRLNLQLQKVPDKIKVQEVPVVRPQLQAPADSGGCVIQ